MKRLTKIVLVLAAILLAAPGFAAKNLTKEERAARLQKAEAMFAERCKTAGEKIYKTVDNVEGVYLLKLRPNNINYSNQFEMDDPYGRDLGGAGYIESFIRGEYGATHRGTPAPGSPPRMGYHYVEAVDPVDEKRYRYTGRIEEPWQYDKRFLKGYTRFVLDKVLASGDPPRYGVTYEDISTREEREYWIAGSSLRVIDLKTDEVMAERVGYMMDNAQGSDAGGRAPWLLAAGNACPTFHRNSSLPTPRRGMSAAQPYQTLDFVEKVLRPKQ